MTVRHKTVLTVSATRTIGRVLTERLMSNPTYGTVINFLRPSLLHGERADKAPIECDGSVQNLESMSPLSHSAIAIGQRQLVS